MIVENVYKSIIVFIKCALYYYLLGVKMYTLQSKYSHPIALITAKILWSLAVLSAMGLNQDEK